MAITDIWRQDAAASARVDAPPQGPDLRGQLRDVLQSCHKPLSEEAERARKAFNLDARGEALLGRRKRQSARLAGDAVLAELRRLLEYFPRPSFQRDFHQAMIETCLPIIYGDDFDTYAEKIIRENVTLLPKFAALLIITAMRRVGKTASTAMFVAAMLFARPSIVQTIFSPMFRQSEFFKRIVIRLCD